MKYRIEVWSRHNPLDKYESDSIEFILEWYEAHWKHRYKNGGCVFNIYKDDEEIDFDDEYEFGFHS